MLNVGDVFPDFHLKDQNDKDWNLAMLNSSGKPTVIYFYPKDDTSGCTTEACEFQELLPSFQNAQVIGVSPDPVKSHKKFADKFGLEFPLLADVEQELCNAVGVWAEKSMYGKKYMGVERTTFLVDPAGVVRKVWNKVKPAGHAQEVQQAIADL